MKKCVNCGSNNDDNEVFCDWCGEKLLPEKKMNLFLFLKYYFHSFAILGIIGAIIYYIATFLINPSNKDYLSRQFLFLSLENVLQFGLFVCFCFFILLLILLIMELLSFRNRNLSLILLLLILLFLLAFTLILFISIGINWLNLIILLITTIFIFALYLYALDHFVVNVTNESDRIRNILLLLLGSIIFLFLFLLLWHQIQGIIDYVSNTPLPSEEAPIILNKISNGFFVGVFFGALLGILLCSIFLIITGIKITGASLINDSNYLYQKIRQIKR